MGWSGTPLVAPPPAQYERSRSFFTRGRGAGQLPQPAAEPQPQPEQPTTKHEQSQRSRSFFARAEQPAGATAEQFGLQVVELLDADADGRVSEAELRAGIASGKLSAAFGPASVAVESARTVFAACDADGDGALDVRELAAIAQRM